MRSFAGRHIISLKDFERHEFERVLEVAEKLAPIAHNRQNVDLLKDKTDRTNKLASIKQNKKANKLNITVNSVISISGKYSLKLVTKIANNK